MSRKIRISLVPGTKNFWVHWKGNKKPSLHKSVLVADCEFIVDKNKLRAYTVGYILAVDWEAVKICPFEIDEDSRLHWRKNQEFIEYDWKPIHICQRALAHQGKWYVSLP